MTAGSRAAVDERAPSASAAAAACPICRGTRWITDDIATRILGVPSPFAVKACAACGQRRLDPYLGEAELLKLYGGAYFGDDGAQSALEGVKSPDASYVDDYVPARLEKFRHTVRALRRMHPAGKSLLDYGAAIGNFVAIAREEGLDAQGVELSSHAVAMAAKRYGITLINGDVTAIPDRRYDFIHLHHVFEHLTWPAEDLRVLVDHLAPRGMLYVEIPFQFHVVEKLRFSLRSRGDVPKPTLLSFHHPYFYTPSTLRTMLQSAGLDVVSIRTFVPAHYPATSPTRAVKKAGWWLLDRVFGLGNIIEALARARG